MSLKFKLQNVFLMGTWAGVLALAGPALAQFGTNTSPCPTHCSPASPWWGYVQTHWTRWPGATYPDMQKAPGGAGEGIPVPGVDVPNPSRESEIRSAPTATPKPATTAPNTELPTEPTPADQPMSDSKSNDMPAVKEAPGATPPADEPFFTPPMPPTGNLPGGDQPPLPSNSSSMLQKSRPVVPMVVQVRTASLELAERPQHVTLIDRSQQHAELTDRSQQQSEWHGEATQTATVKPLRLKLDVDDFSEPVSSDGAPRVIAPSSTARPLAAQNGDMTNQNAASSGNPLRVAYQQGSATTTSTNSGTVYQSNSIRYSDSQPTSYQR
jgi:hypothetical protein